MAKRKWKEVDLSSLLVGGEGGFVSLEELEGDVWDLGNDGSEAPDQAPDEKNQKSKKKGKKKEKKKVKAAVSDGEELQDPSQAPDEAPNVKTQKSKKKKKKKKKNKQETSPGGNTGTTGDQTENDQTEEYQPETKNLPDWEALRIHPKLVKALALLGFKSPTPIQKACIPAAAHKGKDVIGAAETGSGKTLAFGIPILQRLLDEQEKLQRKDNVELPANNSLRALIVTPTRELALQICDHIRAVAKFTDFKVAPIVGGISTQKQERLLKQKPAIVVGTPGRLWELISAGENHLSELQALSFFILDEADRMVEKGHFQELHSIIDFLPTKQKETSEESELADTIVVSAKKRRQTLVFSATLTLPADFKKKLKKATGASKPSNQYSVAFLSEKAGITSNVEVVDLTSKHVVAEKLSESAIECNEQEKDVFLYYVLKVHGSGRSIVFCTSIAALRRLSAILRVLEVPAWPLHAQLQQRQRLKTMDKFRMSTDGVLIATDVAARGLDIPGVRTVIHYQLPHSAEMYVHRSGRTARAESDGCSIALISSSEKSKYISLCAALSKSSGLGSFPINPAYLPALKKRVSLAVKIDKVISQGSKTKAKDSWFQRNAKDLELDLSEDDEEQQPKKNSKQSSELRNLQEELKHLLKQPLETKGFSKRYVAAAGLTPLAAQQLKEYVAKPGHGRFVVIGQEEMEPLQALKRSRTQ